MAGFTVEQLHADIAFLSGRAGMSGAYVCDAHRSWGSSSNAIVALAYGGKQTALPHDWGDYAACVRAVRLLPRHRRTPEVYAALLKARAEVVQRYPNEANGAMRRAERERWAAERAAMPKRRRRWQAV